jgi:DtxR family Mn-dependent transcriptional regulator
MKHTKGIEDYLEAIYVLTNKKSVVRIKNIAEFLSVKLPSVTEAVQRLLDDGFVKHTPYGEVILTDRGRKIGKVTWDKHQLVQEFFKDVLGVSDSVAFKEACLIEHSISEETKSKIKEFMEKHRGK